MNKAELREDVRERIGERVENFWLDTFIDRHLIQGVRRFNNEERWPWLLTKQGNIPLPAALSTIELIDNIPVNRHLGLVLHPDTDLTTDLVLKRVSLPEALRHIQDYAGTASTPTMYFSATALANAYDDGDTATAVTLTVLPTPDVDYTADFYYYRDDLVVLETDEDEPRLPESYQDAVIAWATAQCFLKELNGGNKAQEQFNLYATILEQAKQDLKELPEDRIITWGGGPSEDLPVWPYDWVLQGPVGL